MDPTRELAAALDCHRDALHALSGVVGTGVGLSSRAETPDKVVIQIYVRSPEYVKEVSHDAAVILGGLRVEVIVSGEVIAGHD